MMLSEKTVLTCLALVVLAPAISKAQTPNGVAGFIPAPAPAADRPYVPQPVYPGGIVVPLYPPDSPLLKKDRIGEPEQYTMTPGAPGRIQSIVNIHNPSIEVHTVERAINTGAAVILAPGGGHSSVVVGTEGTDFVPYFYNFGVNTVILRYRLRRDGYNPQTDAVHDAQQAIRIVRARAKEWGIDTNKIGIVGFSAGAELAAPAALAYENFDRENAGAGDSQASARPDFVGLIYPGPTPFQRDPNTPIPRNAPPSFITCAGSGDSVHAVWADQYFAAMLKAGVPNLEMHIYGRGVHAGGLQDRDGAPFGKWHDRFIDWFRDLGFLQKPGQETRAARDVAAYASRPPPGAGRRAGTNSTPPNPIPPP
jgi:endo-1,4-beta-xylanase